MNRRRFACAAGVGLLLVVPSVVPSIDFSLAQAQPATEARQADGPAGSDVIEFPKIDRRPGPAKWKRPRLTTLPVFDLSQMRQNPWQIDLRHRDASGLVVPHRLADLLQASFDASTQAYIDYMRPRCVELARVLNKTGSLTTQTETVHCTTNAIVSEGMRSWQCQA